MSHDEPALPAPDERGNMGPSIWHNRHFMLLWAAQVVGQTAQNAVHFGLLVLVQTRTHSAAHMSFAVLTVVLPSVIFGLVAGAYVDRRDKRLVLIGTNLARAALMPLYVVFPEWLLVIYGLSFLFSTVSQFFAPAELAMLPTVVKRGHLLQANSLFQVTFTASQLIGFVILGPLVVNLWDIAGLFWVIGGMLVVAAVCTWPLPSTHRRLDQQIRGFRDLWREIFYVLRYIRSDAIISLAVIQWTVGSTLMLIVATLAPNFVVHILQVRAEDTVFVLAPAGVGTVLGSLALGRYGARVDRLRLVRSALVAVGLLVCLMALAGPVWQSLGWVSYAEGAEPTFWGHWSLISVVMALAFVTGIGFVSILVPTQTVIQERAEEGVRGRLFAVQLVLANVASVLPLVVLGELADHLGVPWTLLLVGLGVLGSGVWSAWQAASRRTAAEQGHHSSAA